MLDWRDAPGAPPESSTDGRPDAAPCPSGNGSLGTVQARAGGQALAERAYAFASAYWILLALSMLSLMPAAALARIGRRERRRPPLLRDPARHAA